MSPTRRSGLGKGLSSLIPADVETDGSTFREIDVDTVVPNRYQPRDHFDEETLSSLAASIAEVGVIQPIVVRATDEGYELIAGERRWRAARRANLPSIPAIVRDSDDLGSLETAVVENLHRQDLNALEEAAAYQQLIEDFGFTQEQVRPGSVVLALRLPIRSGCSSCRVLCSDSSLKVNSVPATHGPFWQLPTRPSRSESRNSSFESV